MFGTLLAALRLSFGRDKTFPIRLRCFPRTEVAQLPLRQTKQRFGIPQRVSKLPLSGIRCRSHAQPRSPQTAQDWQRPEKTERFGSGMPRVEMRLKSFGISIFSLSLRPSFPLTGLILWRHPTEKIQTACISGTSKTDCYSVSMGIKRVLCGSATRAMVAR